MAAVQTEQLYDRTVGGIFHGNSMLTRLRMSLKRYDIVFDFLQSNIDAMRKYAGKKTLFSLLPVPYYGSLECSPVLSAACEKKYDLLFLGNWSKTDSIDICRRRDIWEFLTSRYNCYPKVSDVWGEEKEKAINESRICLNIHTDEGRFCETTRLFDFFKKGAFVLSERMNDQSVFIRDEDYGSFALYDMEEKIDYYLAHGEERLAIAKNARDKVSKMNMDDNIEAMLDSIVLEQRERQFRKRYRLRYRKWVFGKMYDVLRHQLKNDWEDVV